MSPADADRQWVVYDYWRHRTHPKLLAILVLCQTHVAGLRRVMDILEDCLQKPCREFYCPRCGPKWVAKQWQRSLNNLLALVGGDWPDPAHISWVMFPGRDTEFDPRETKQALAELRKKLSNEYNRGSLKGTIVHGMIDLSLRSVLHAHVWLYHPHMTRAELATALPGRFPGMTKKDIEPFWSDQHIGEALAKTISYAFDGRPRETELFYDIREADLPERIASRLVCLEALSKGGFRGCRISHGMHGAAAKVKQMLKSPQKLAQRRRRAQTEYFRQEILAGKQAATSTPDAPSDRQDGPP